MIISIKIMIKIIILIKTIHNLQIRLIKKMFKKMYDNINQDYDKLKQEEMYRIIKNDYFNQ